MRKGEATIWSLLILITGFLFFLYGMVLFPTFLEEGTQEIGVIEKRGNMISSGYRNYYRVDNPELAEVHDSCTLEKEFGRLTYHIKECKKV